MDIHMTSYLLHRVFIYGKLRDSLVWIIIVSSTMRNSLEIRCSLEYSVYTNSYIVSYRVRRW